MNKKVLTLVSSAVGLVVILVVIALVGGIYLYRSSPNYDSRSVDLGYIEDMTSSYMPMDSKGYGVSEIGSVTGIEPTFESRIKKNGYVNLLVSNIDKSYSQLKDILDEKDGTILNSYDSGEGNDRYVQVQVKIESKNFEDVMEGVLALEGELESSSVDTQDITEEYIDAKARLSNLRDTETQLLQILKSADNVTDTLSVYRELTNIRSQIEVYEGQIKYMDSQTDYSYITIVFAVNKEGLNIAQDEWKPVGEFKVALSSLVNVIKGIGNLLIWIVVFSPLLLIPLGIVWIVKRQKKVN
jgi:hypothetical protein